jgi:hypothetical protein
MNTLSKSITSKILGAPEEYDALRKQWRELTNSNRRHTLSAGHHLLYLTLCGKDWRKAFSPVSNLRKLENGAYWNWGLFRAMRFIHSKLQEKELLEVFDGIVASEALNQIRRIVPLVQPHQYKPEDFGSGSYPFEAYDVPNTFLRETEGGG